MANTEGLSKVNLLKSEGMAELYTGDVGERETLEDFTPFKSFGETYYLSSETATCTSIGSGKGIKGNKMEDKRKKMGTELHI